MPNTFHAYEYLTNIASMNIIIVKQGSQKIWELAEEERASLAYSHLYTGL